MTDAHGAIDRGGRPTHRGAGAAAPVVSIIIPMYNVRRYIGATLQSVLGQTFGDYEAIVVDDGSTDGSGEIVAEFVRRDPRVKLIRQANAGVAVARNRAIEASRGEFLAMLDADDLAAPDRLEAQLAYLRAHPDVVCVGGGYDWIDARGRKLAYVSVATEDAEIQERALSGITPFCLSTLTARRSALNCLAHAFDQSLAPTEDLDLVLRLGELGRLANIDRPLAQYRVHSASASGTQRETQMRNWRRTCELAWARRGIRDGQFRVEGHWRPAADHQSQLRYTVRCGWMAFRHGHRGTSLIYAAKALRLNPFHKPAWKLMACGLIKRMPKPDGPSGDSD